MNGFVNGGTVTEKLGLGPSVRELKFGAGFTAGGAGGGGGGRTPAAASSFHTIR